MKWTLASTLAALLAWSLIAHRLIPQRSDRGHTVLTWISDDNPTRRDQVNLFNELHRDQGVEVRLDPANIGVEKVIVQCIGGVGPDVFDVYNRDQLQDYARTGVLLPLDEFAAAGGFSPEATWPQMRREICLKLFDPDTGESPEIQFSFPCNVEAPVMYYNRRAFDDAGEPYPTDDWTWEEFLIKAERLVRRDARGRVLRYAVATYESWETVELIWQFGGSIYHPTGTFCTADSPEAVEAVTFLRRMLDSDVMPSIASQGGWGGNMLDLFAQESVAMIRAGRWGMITFRRKPVLKGHIGAVQMPGQRERVVICASRSCGINRNSPNREAALKFLQFLASEPYSDYMLACADALPPLESATRSEKFLHDPEHPEEDFNAEFAEAVHRGRNLERCPFVQPSRVVRVFNRYLALLGAGSITPEQFCRRLTDEINNDMRTNLGRYPSMRAEFRHLTGRDFDPGDFPPADLKGNT